MPAPALPRHDLGRAAFDRQRLRRDDRGLVLHRFDTVIRFFVSSLRRRSRGNAWPNELPGIEALERECAMPWYKDVDRLRALVHPDFT